MEFSLQNEQFKGLLWQILVIGLAVVIIGYLWSNAIHNLSVRRI